ncbi:MAG: hypothetical protein KGL02_13885 [Acidobacteriota bacterium]|nr:hypothetical protein [Acidobacteriota bacterium]
MDRRKMLALLGIGPAFAATPSYTDAAKVPAHANRAAAFEPKMAVLSPMGTPPPIKLLGMAPRPQSLEGKTIYFVDDGFPGTDVLMKQMVTWFNQSVPGVTAVYRLKTGGFPQVDEPLWAEIKAKGDAVVMGVGH